MIGEPGALDAQGVFGGVQVGYNWQREHVVFGIEADIQDSDINDRVGGFYSNNPAFAGVANADLDWFGTVRGRLGYATGRMLIYATGGLAYGDVDFNSFAVDGATGNSIGIGRDKTKIGYTVGGGVEYALDPKWSMKLEYQYINLGDETVVGEAVSPAGAPTGETFKSGYDFDVHTVRAGLNYRF